MVTYVAMLDVPRALVQHLGLLLRAERRGRGTPRGVRALTCFRQAVLVLRWFRDGTRVDRLAHDFGISTATAYRYLHEGIAVLAAQAPDLHEALDQARDAGLAHVILDGSLIPTDRVGQKVISKKGKEIHLWYSGKHEKHGGNIQFLATPDGFPLWTSDVRPGSVPDIEAARELALPALYYAARDGLKTLADKGYQGAGAGVLVPVKHQINRVPLDHANRTYNSLLTRLRALGERAMALLKTRWKALQHITLDPNRTSDITRACLVLTHFEHSRTH